MPFVARAPGDGSWVIVDCRGDQLAGDDGRCYRAAVDGSGVRLVATDGSRALVAERWIPSNAPLRFEQAEGALDGFTFFFYDPGPGQTLHALFRSPHDRAETRAALKQAGFRKSTIDLINLYQLLKGHAEHFRSRGNQRGHDSGHAILYRLPRFHREDGEVSGEVHFGEIDPNRRPLAHLTAHLRDICRGLRERRA